MFLLLRQCGSLFNLTEEACLEKNHTLFQVLEKSLKKTEIFLSFECFGLFPQLAVFVPQVEFLIAFPDGN